MNQYLPGWDGDLKIPKIPKKSGSLNAKVWITEILNSDWVNQMARKFQSEKLKAWPNLGSFIITDCRWRRCFSWRIPLDGSTWF